MFFSKEFAFALFVLFWTIFAPAIVLMTATIIMINLKIEWVIIIVSMIMLSILVIIPVRIFVKKITQRNLEKDKEFSKKQTERLYNELAVKCFNQAKKYFEENRLDTAINEIGYAIKHNPNYIEAYEYRSFLHSFYKNYEIALADLNKVIELNPSTDSDIYIKRGQCYFELKDYTRAFEDFEKAIDLNPDNSETYKSYGICNLRLGWNDTALKHLNDAIRLSDVNTKDNILSIHNTYDNYFYRGLCYLKLKNYELALADYNKYFQIKDSKLNFLFKDNSYLNRGDCYYHLQNFQLAITDYDKYIEKNPSDAVAYNNRANCYVALGNYELALADYDKSIEFNPNDSTTYYNRAVCYKQQGNYELSLEDSNKSVTISELPEDKNRSLILKADVLETAKNKELEKINEQLKTEIAEKEEAQRQLEEKNKALNNLIAMFAHNFLGTLQCIRSNAEHDNNPKIHLKTVKMMSGALTAFSIISADDDRLIEQLKQDNRGEVSLLQNLANNLALAVSQLLSKTNKDKIINLYLHYFRKTNQISTETDGEELRKNKEYRKKWQALQHQWEDEFNTLFSENVELPQLQKWLETNFFPVQIKGFDDYPIRFNEYGITDSIFLIVFMEILVNALKYSDVSQHQPLIITLCKQDHHYQLTCENPSAQETGRGTHKGTDFLKSIAHKLNGEFITEYDGQQFNTIFTIPAELLD